MGEEFGLGSGGVGEKLWARGWRCRRKIGARGEGENMGLAECERTLGLWVGAL